MSTTPAQAVRSDVGGAAHERWLVLLGAVMVQSVLGTLYGFSALIKPVQEQFKDWSAQDIQKAFQFAILVFAITMLFAGRLQDRKGPRLPALIGAVTLCLGALLGSLVPATGSKLLWWLSYGVILGAGTGLTYVCPIAALAKWFPEVKGLITGVAVAGFGGGAAIFVPTVAKFLDPKVGHHSLTEFFYAHALICLVVVGAGALLLRNPPEGWQPPQPAKAAAAKPATVDLSWREMLATPRFWLLVAMFFGSALAGLMAIGVVKAAVESITFPVNLPVSRVAEAIVPLAKGQKFADVTMVTKIKVVTAQQAALAAVLLSICNALGRILWGGISERLGRPRAMLINFLLQAVAMFTLFAAINAAAKVSFDQMAAAAGAQGMYQPLEGWHPAALVAVLFMGFIGANFGGVLALFPSATADAFGTKNLGLNYACVFMGYGLAGYLGPQIAAYYKDVKHAYDPAFLIGGALVALAAVGAVALIAMGRPKAVDTA